MAKKQRPRDLTKREIIDAVRGFAERLSVRGVLMKGQVPNGLRSEIKQFLLQAGLPFSPWAKTEFSYGEGKRIATAKGEAVEAISQYLLACADWEMGRDTALQYFEGWSQTDAEGVIREAARELPRLCNILERKPTSSETLSPDTAAATKPNGKRGGVKKEKEDEELLSQYERGLEQKRWGSVQAFANHKRRNRSTVSKALKRARDERELKKSELKRSR